MRTELRFAIGLLFAGATLTTTAVAAKGTSIAESEEPSIAVGMNATDVTQLLGRPASAYRYRNAPGATWTYHVRSGPFGPAEFDIDFGADGRVRSVAERIIGWC